MRAGLPSPFLVRLERCNPGQLDNDRYGIVVRSLERPEKMGGALPRMPGISNEWEQFQHARIKNAQLVSFEPYELFRHHVVKTVEPGMPWQLTGAPAPEKLPWHEDESVCGPIATRARDLVVAKLFNCPQTTAPLNDSVVLGSLDSFYLTIYINGHLRGCMGSAIRNFNEDIEKIVEAALGDERFTVVAPNDPGSVAVAVSLLFNPLELGEISTEDVGSFYRHGQQTLMAYRGEQFGLLLPSVVATGNLDRVSFAEAILEKAGLVEPPYYWCRFDCVSWFADGRGVWPIVGGFPSMGHHAPTVTELVTHHGALHARYLLKHLQEDGTFYSWYQPFQDRLYKEVDLARLAHGAWVLARGHKVLGNSDLKQGAERVIDYLSHRVLPDEQEIWLNGDTNNPSVAETSFLTLALNNLPEKDPDGSLRRALAATLWKCIELPHGRISTHRTHDPSLDAFQDYFPGQVLLALATASEEDDSTIDEEKLHQSFLFYRHRFRYNRHFGQVTWLMQAFAKWWQVTKELCFAGMVFEIADWLLGYQQTNSGAFINDHQSPTPGYTTAVYLEGIAAALNVAAGIKDDNRYQVYCRSFAQGFSFLDRLIIQERDRSIIPNLDWALGGLRQGIYYSEVRIDFVQHSLSAILEFMSHQQTRERLCPGAAQRSGAGFLIATGAGRSPG